MAKISYLEVAAMLGTKVGGDAKGRLDHIIARKSSLKGEDDDLNHLLDELLREIQEGGREL